MIKTCRNMLEYFTNEYVRYGEEWFQNETMCAEKMLIYKKLAGMVIKAHEVYHIALELEHGVERDAASDAAMLSTARKITQTTSMM